LAWTAVSSTLVARSLQAAIAASMVYVGFLAWRGWQTLHSAFADAGSGSGIATGLAIDLPHVTVIVPARDEAAVIGALIGDLRAQAYAADGQPRFDILVVDDGSRDGSGELPRHPVGRDRDAAARRFGQPPVVQPVAGCLGPAARGAFGRLRGGVRGGRVVHQHGDHGGDGRPPSRRTHVEVAQLEETPQPHRREQRGQVGLQVRDGRGPVIEQRAPGHPVLERDDPADGPGLASARSDEHHRSLHRVTGPFGGRLVASEQRPAAATVELGPHALARGLPAGVMPAEPRRARRQRDERRAELVGQADAGAPRRCRAGLQVDL